MNTELGHQVIAKIYGFIRTQTVRKSIQTNNLRVQLCPRNQCKDFADLRQIVEVSQVFVL